MANIFDYLIWRGDLPLSVSPFNEVDGAVFARLSYLPFELIMPCDSPVSVTIADAAAALISLNIKKPGSLRKENDAKLLEMLLNSRRFRDIELFGYSHLFDAATQTQFSAVTFRPSKNKLYVFFAEPTVRLSVGRRISTCVLSVPFLPKAMPLTI